MWEKVLGGESGERYLCFTKEDKVSTATELVSSELGRSAE